MAVEFNEPEFTKQVSKPKPKSSFSGLMIKWGLAKTDKGAQDALLVLALLIFVVAGIIFWFTIS